MNLSIGRRRGLPGAERDPWLKLLSALLIVVTGVALGFQYVYPNKRVLAVVAAVLMAGVVWRLDMVAGLGLLLIALPYPRATTIGSTNLTFVLLLGIMWLLRITQGQSARPQPTLLGRPMVALLIAFAVSFYNVRDAELFGRAVGNMMVLLHGMLIYYLIAANVRSSRDLELLHRFQLVSIVSICLIAIYELNHPRGVLIPGWIEFRGTHGTALDTRNVRVGGPFFDFELLSEFCAMQVPLVTFMLLRARSTARRALFAALLLLLGFVQFATVTRGGMISLGLGLLYMAWLLRRQFSFVKFAAAAALAIGLLFGMNFVVSHYTRSGDLLERLLAPETREFEYGMPLNRVGLWTEAFERMMQHPIIGWGPVYDTRRGVSFWYWPHNGYLYVGNLVGLVGLGFYLWLLVLLWRATRPHFRNVQLDDYATAYLPIAHTQLFIFLVDQLKIDFMRNPIYTVQVFAQFGVLAAGAQVARRVAASPSAPAAP